MSVIKYCVHKVTTIPPHILTKKIAAKLYRKYKQKSARKRDLNFDTHIKSDCTLIKKSYIDINNLDLSQINAQTAKYLCEMYLSHRFDLLGSGWIENSYNSEALGLEGYKYNDNVQITKFDKEGNWLYQILLPNQAKSAKKIWQFIDLDEYQPIDWQKDFKSGHRWDSKSWYLEQKFGHRPGIDIKVPWELSRFQHLPQMALFSLILPSYRDKLIKEFRSQVLDFIATNPPRMGANWVCPMDVAIRAANMLVAYDIFSQIDKYNILENKFKQIFANSIYEHGLHIINNLEYSETLTSNHYLSDIAGLLFISAYLERTATIDRWLAFSVQEMISEINKQFYNDGTNFEASTCYHRLSGELFIYSTALILGLDEDKKQALKSYNPKGWKVKPNLKNKEKQEFNSEKIFPDWYIENLYKSGLFTADLTKPTGEIPQIGDNDSGRFFRFSPVGEFLKTVDVVKKYKNLSGYNSNSEELFWDENQLNQSSFISSVNGLFDEEKFKFFSKEVPLEYTIISSLAKNKKFTNVNKKTDDLYIDNLESTELNKYKYSNQTILKPIESKSKSLKENVKAISYPDSGIYIFKSDRIHLTISAGPNGQCGNGGHAHNDKLSFELNIDGKDMIVDPGTYLYTPIPERRNQFRLTSNHNTLFVENIEQNFWTEGPLGLFNMRDESKCELITFEDSKIAIKLNYKKVEQIRIIEIQDDQIVINDYSNVSFKVNLNKFNLYSNGYGKLINA